MKLHNFDECAAAAFELRTKKGATIHQQWNCAHWGAKQTMETPNKFFTHGVCEECGKGTNIKQDGCNYMIIYGRAKNE